MHATIHSVRRPVDAGTDPQHVLRTALDGGPRPAGAIVVEHRDGGEGTVVALWPEEAQAPAGARACGLVDRLDGVAAGRTPLFASLTWLNGADVPVGVRS